VRKAEDRLWFLMMGVMVGLIPSNLGHSAYWPILTGLLLAYACWREKD
jgi:hypothetical protein